MSDMSDSTVQTVQEILDIKAKISEEYVDYNLIKEFVAEELDTKKGDFKRAVDAIHYLGGGYPNETSKGRMEALLDNFAGMYRVLHLIGRGDLVETHLSQYGISVKLTAADELNEVVNESFVHKLNKSMTNEDNIVRFDTTNLTRKQVLSKLVDICDEIQTTICGLADEVRLVHKEKLKNETDMTNEEYSRIIRLGQLISKRKMLKAAEKFSEMDESFEGLETLFKKLR